jgi:hypothetical protein
MPQLKKIHCSATVLETQIAGMHWGNVWLIAIYIVREFKEEPRIHDWWKNVKEKGKTKDLQF